ncbi:MAG TPA: hypothetical protein DEA22_11640 [Blastocatellia bacterium]|nr:hypothetical protein [Blastocatellia bacterium]
MISRLLVTFLVLGSMSLASCTAEKAPATPLETFKTYVKALKKKDTTTMKLLLSAGSIKMHEQEAKSQGVTVDEIVMRETLFSESQKTVDFRNEKIEGNRASIELKNHFGEWEIIPFVMEDGQWKIDKKGYVDNLLEQMEQKNRELDEIINQGRQAPDEIAPVQEQSPDAGNPVNP